MRPFDSTSVCGVALYVRRTAQRLSHENLLFALSMLTLVALRPALAQSNVAFDAFGSEGDLLASELVGADLYTTPVAFDHDRIGIDAVPDDWERIATISDVVMGMDGQVRGILGDIGDFLGLGARTVMVRMESVHIATRTGSNARTVAISMDQLEIQGDEDASDLRVYLAITEAQLEALPEHDAD